jgi:NAD(P)H-nitrite reductase large subunit
VNQYLIARKIAIMQIGIIGAGHAGIEAALAARLAGAEATVFSAEPVLPYFRPRLIAVAMGQAAPDAIALHPASWYEERGIHLRLATPVTALDAAGRAVVAGGATEKFDALVLACGALPQRPHFSGETPATPIFTLWSLADAVAIRQRVRSGARLVVIGGACLGIESALRASEQKLQTTIVERLPRLMPLLLGEGAAAFLQRLLADRGVQALVGHAVMSFAEASGGSAKIGLDDGSAREVDLALVCIGAAPNLTLARQAGLATARGICTDACLQAAPGVFVAGDVCQAAGRPARGAVREANAQGRLAGANAAAFVTGGTLQELAPVVVPMTVRCAGVEINVAGQASGEGVFEQRLDDGATSGVFRAVTRRADGGLAGVQMIGTREGFDDLAGRISG